MLQTPIISADSHFVEPPGMWRERIDARFRDRAPTNEPGPEGGEFLVIGTFEKIGTKILIGWDGSRAVRDSTSRVLGNSRTDQAQSAGASGGWNIHSGSFDRLARSQ